MSLSNQTDKIGPFIITGLPQVIPVSFPFQAGDELIVYDSGALGTTNDPALVLTLNSDYTVAGGGYDSANTMQTGSITVVGTGAHSVLVGDYLVIARNVPINQTTSFQASGPLTIQQVEQALDKQATLSQQVNEVASRSLRFEASEFNDGVLLRTARAGKLLGFDANGNVSFSMDSTGSGGTYTAGAGLQLNANEFSVLPDQTFENLTVTNSIVGNLAGNANTATSLQTPRNINGIAFDGTANITVPAAAGTLTGTALASNVTTSSLLTVAAGTIGTMAIQNANGVAITGGSINGATVTGLANGVNPSDAVNLSQLQGVSSGIVLRTGVVAATTANITLSGPQTIDGQAVIAGNRVLVKNQTAPAENGIYDVAAGAWTRSSDSNTAGELLVGYTYFVSSGTVNGASTWSINVAPTVLNTDPVGFVQFSAAQAYSAGTGLSLAGNVFSISPTQSGLTITSSAFNGTIGATTPSSAAFTTQTTTGNSFMANLVIKANQINEQATNGTSSVNINYDGYAGGTTQFRDTTIYDGKNTQIAKFTGSTKGLAVGGVVTASQLSTAGSTAQVLGNFTSSATDPYIQISNGTITGFFEAYGTDPSVVIGSNTGHPLKFFFSGFGFAAKFDSTGMNETAIGTTTPSTGRFTTISSSSNANIRTTKGNFNTLVNVKDYGALGDGSTNDTSAISTAKAAAISTSGVLYFPKGTYITDTITFTGAAGLTIFGDGMGVSTIKARTPSQVLNGSSSSKVNVYGLTFNGNCTTRTAGQQAVIFDTITGLDFHHNEIINSGEFAIMVGLTSGSDVRVTNNFIGLNYADGINIQNVTRYIIANNMVDGADDDCIAVNGSHGLVIGNSVKPRNDLGTSTGRGIWSGFNGTDIEIIGNYVDSVKQTGIFINQESTNKQTRIKVIGNTIVNTPLVSGFPINFVGTLDCSIENNSVYDPPISVAGLIEIANWENLKISGNKLYQRTNGKFARGIHVEEGTGYPDTAWDDLTIKGNEIYLTGTSTSNGIYLQPNAANTMSYVIIDGNIVKQQAAVGNYIQLSGATATLGKIINNTTMIAGATISPSSSGGAFTVANNN